MNALMKTTARHNPAEMEQHASQTTPPPPATLASVPSVSPAHDVQKTWSNAPAALARAIMAGVLTPMVRTPVCVNLDTRAGIVMRSMSHVNHLLAFTVGGVSRWIS